MKLPRYTVKLQGNKHANYQCNLVFNGINIYIYLLNNTHYLHYIVDNEINNKYNSLHGS